MTGRDHVDLLRRFFQACADWKAAHPDKAADRQACVNAVIGGSFNVDERIALCEGASFTLAIVRHLKALGRDGNEALAILRSIEPEGHT